MYTGSAKKSNKRKRTTPKRKLTNKKPQPTNPSDTKPVAIPGAPPVITPEDMDMLDDSSTDLLPPPPLVRSKAFVDPPLEEKKESTEVATQTPVTTPHELSHNKKNCKRMFQPYSKAEMMDKMDADGYYKLTEKDQKSSLNLRRAVKTARMYPVVYLDDSNMFKVLDRNGVKASIQLNGRNASRSAGAAQQRGLTAIAACYSCGIPLSVSLLKDFGFGAKAGSEALKAFQSLL